MSVVSEKQRARNASSRRNDSELGMPELPSLLVEGEDVPPPAYSELHNEVHFSQAGFDAGAQVTGKGHAARHKNLDANSSTCRRWPS